MEEKLADLLLIWEERTENGDPVSVEELCRDVPELTEPLRARVEALRRISWVDQVAQSEAAPLMGRLRPGMQILAYRLEKFLGRGGFAEVWEAAAENRPNVALKFVPMVDGQDKSEARLLEQLRRSEHPHLLKIEDDWVVDGVLVLALELAQGTLYDRFKQARESGQVGLPMAELLEHMEHAAEALDYLHERGIHHRDVKPQNLLLVDGTLKVADFGLARLMEQTVMSHSGAMTPAYAAPEFFNGQTSRHSDQYSLAISYCELRGGRPPFVGNPAQVMAGHLHAAPDLTMLPESERPAVARALAKDPGDRWPSCREFINNLSSKTQQTVLWPPAGRSRAMGRRRWRPIIACLVAAALLSAIGALYWHRRPPAEGETVSIAPSNNHKSGAEDNQLSPNWPANAINFEMPWKTPTKIFFFDGQGRIITPVERFIPTTLEAWIKPAATPDATGDDRDKHFFSTDVPGKSALGLYLTYLQGSTPPYIVATQPKVPAVQVPHFLALEKWAHVAAVFGPEATVVYVNGKEVGRGKPCPNVPGNVFSIGGHGPTNPSKTNNFTGRIHSARISKGTRYLGGFTPPLELVSDAASVCILRADNCDGLKAIDKSGHGNHGTMEGVKVVIEQPNTEGAIVPATPVEVKTLPGLQGEQKAVKRTTLSNGGPELDAILQPLSSAPAVWLDEDSGGLAVGYTVRQGPKTANERLFACFFDAQNKRRIGPVLLGNDSKFDHHHPRLARIGTTKSYIVVWHARTRETPLSPYPPWRILARIIDQSGSVSPECRVDAQIGGRQFYPAVAYSEAASELVVAWTDGSNTGRFKVVARRYSADGTALGSQFDINPKPMTNEGNPALAVLPDGRIFFMWAQWHNRKQADGVYAILRRSEDQGATPFRINENEIQGQEHYNCVAAVLPGSIVLTSWQLNSGEIWLFRRKRV